MLGKRIMRLGEEVNRWARIRGASERDRTSDLLITNQLLYRLSYAGLEARLS
jgi:hypothetical protein